MIYAAFYTPTPLTQELVESMLTRSEAKLGRRPNCVLIHPSREAWRELLVGLEVIADGKPVIAPGELYFGYKESP